MDLGTTYYYKAYATNAAGTTYGSVISLATQLGRPHITGPTINTTIQPSSFIVTWSSVPGAAKYKVFVRDLKTQEVFVNYETTSTSYNVYTNYPNKVVAGNSYRISVEAISSSGVEAWQDNATDSAGGYSPVIIAGSYVNKPTMQTSAATSVTQSTATLNGTVSSNGGGTITNYGFYWGTSSNPTTMKSVGSSITAPKSYATVLSGLSAGTTYYYKAYATNTAGTTYGSVISFKTSAIQVSKPTMQTSTATSVTQSTATLNGTVSSNGGGTITNYGFYWGTSSNPTTMKSVGSSITAPKSYATVLSGLSAGTTYYYKAYATNAAGTTYGSVLSFTTQPYKLTDNDWNIRTSSDGNALEAFVNYGGQKATNDVHFYLVIKEGTTPLYTGDASTELTWGRSDLPKDFPGRYYSKWSFADGANPPPLHLKPGKTYTVSLKVTGSSIANATAQKTLIVPLPKIYSISPSPKSGVAGQQFVFTLTVDYWTDGIRLMSENGYSEDVSFSDSSIQVLSVDLNKSQKTIAFQRNISNSGNRTLIFKALKGDQEGGTGQVLFTVSAGKSGSMQASQNLVNFIAQYESYKQYPYRGADSQNLTVGYGHVIKSGENYNSGLSIDQAKQLLLSDLSYRVSKVNGFTGGINLSQHKFDALVSFAFNCGVDALGQSTLLKDIKSGTTSNSKLKDDFLMWVKCNGVKLGGLWRRRVDEWQIYTSGEYNREYPTIPQGYK